MTINYIRKIEGIFTTAEADGHGGVDITYTQYHDLGSSLEQISLDFEEVERLYLTARAHREAYQAFQRRGYDDEAQYERDFQDAWNAVQSFVAARDAED